MPQTQNSGQARKVHTLGHNQRRPRFMGLIYVTPYRGFSLRPMIDSGVLRPRTRGASACRTTPTLESPSRRWRTALVSSPPFRGRNSDRARSYRPSSLRMGCACFSVWIGPRCLETRFLVPYFALRIGCRMRSEARPTTFSSSRLVAFALPQNAAIPARANATKTVLFIVSLQYKLKTSSDRAI